MCLCFETRTSYIRPDGNSGVARLSYRCATHRAELRVRNACRWHVLNAYAIARARRTIAAPVTGATLLLPAPEENQGLTLAPSLQ